MTKKTNTVLNPVIFSKSQNAPHPIDVHVGQKLRERRIRVGISQERLADATSVTFQQIQKYEIAKNRISASRLYQFSILLNVDVDYFFKDFNPNISKDSEGLSDNEQAVFMTPARAKEEQKLNNIYFAIEDEKVRKSLLQTMKTLASS